MSTDKQSDESKEEYIIPVWQFFGEHLIEPLVLAFTVFVFFTHIQLLIDSSSSFDEFDQLLAADMSTNPWLYVAFGTVFFAWLAYKTARARRDYAKDKRLLDRFDKLDSRLDNLTSELHSLVSEMRKDRESKKLRDEE